MNYWLLTTEYPPFSGGGISTYCRFTAEMFSKNGHQVSVFVVDNAVNSFKEENPATNIRIIRFNSNFNNAQKSLGYAAGLSYAFSSLVQLFLQHETPDFIEGQDYLGITYYLLCEKLAGHSLLQNVPILITLHSPAFLYLEQNRVPTYAFPDFHTCEMEKYAILSADYLLSPTNFLKEEIFHSLKKMPVPLSVVNNPFSPLTGEANPYGNFTRNELICYGKMSPQKGTFELLEYFSSLWDSGVDCRLHFIGGDEIVYHPEGITMGQSVRKKYSEYITQGKLKLSKKIKPDQIATALSGAHAVILPSKIDNQPYALMEAMSLAKVVLTSIQGGQREMITNGADGFLFDHNLTGDFSTQLQNILSLDKESLSRIGRAARNRVTAEYSFDKVYAQKSEILAQVKNNRKKRTIYPFLYQEEGWKQFNNSYSDKDQLTVVIPFYNMGTTIDGTILSIRQSTYTNIDILIINDGSTERESIARLKTFENQKGISVHHQKHAGLAEARNTGAGIAAGNYLAFLDADDQVDPAYYEKAVNVLNRYENVFFAGSWVAYFGNSSRTWPAFTPQPPYFLTHNSINSSGLVYKKHAFLQAGRNDKLVDYGLEDYESVISLLAAGFNGVVLNEPLFRYCVRDNSMFRKINRMKLLYSYKYIAEKHAGYFSKFAAQITNLLNANGPGFLFDNPTYAVAVTSNLILPGGTERRIISFIKRYRWLKQLALYLRKLKSENS